MSPQDVIDLRPHERRELAVRAVCDVRTVRRFMHGLPVRSTSAVRLERAFVELKRDSTPPDGARLMRTTPGHVTPD